MGNPNSKIDDSVSDDFHGDERLPSTPILTTKLGTGDWDPRSPSTNVIRTPIEIFTTPRTTAATDNIETRLESNCEGLNQLRLHDPRSPSVEITRTPILIENKKYPPIKLHNKNLDKARMSLGSSTNSLHVKLHKRNRTIGPILLESTPVPLKPHENKRKSYVGLLETNIDYEETDLDSINVSHKLNELVDKLQQENVNSCDLLVDEKADNVEINLSKEHLDSTCEETVVDTKYVEISHSNPIETDDTSITDGDIGDIAVTDNRGPNIDVISPNVEISAKKITCHGENTCALNENSSENNTEVSNYEKKDEINRACIINGNNTRISSFEKVDEIENDDIEKIEDTTEQTIRKEICSSVTTKNDEFPALTIKNFDKKLTNLIYEEKIFNNKFAKTESYSEGRTGAPLATRNSIIPCFKRNETKLRVSDKPRSYKKRDSSKIPIPKAKQTKSQLAQCENALPKNAMGDGKKKSRWDSDNTLII